MYMYSRKYRKQQRKSGLTPKSNDRCWHLRHQMSHRSRRSGWSLWRSSLDPRMFGVHCWIPIVGKRDTRSLMRRGCSTQWYGYRSDSRTTSQWFHLSRTESLDSNFSADYVPIGLGLGWCSGMIDTFGRCTWPLSLSRLCRLFPRRRMEHVSVGKHLEGILIPVATFHRVFLTQSDVPDLFFR